MSHRPAASFPDAKKPAGKRFFFTVYPESVFPHVNATGPLPSQLSLRSYYNRFPGSDADLSGCTFADECTFAQSQSAMTYSYPYLSPTPPFSLSLAPLLRRLIDAVLSIRTMPRGLSSYPPSRSTCTCPSRHPHPSSIDVTAMARRGLTHRVQ